MKREEIKDIVLKDNSKAILLELATGVGKTYLTIQKLLQLNPSRVLVIVPKKILIDGWKEEFKKFEATDLLKKVTFCCYPSIIKHTQQWDVVVLDESHHVTPKAILDMRNLKVDRFIFLSATISFDKWHYIKHLSSKHHGEVSRHKVSLSDAIDSEVLPTPKFEYHPLDIHSFNKVEHQYPLVKARGGRIVVIEKNDISHYTKNQREKVNIMVKCTAREYMDFLEKDIEALKKKYEMSGNINIKNLWLSKCRDRLVFLAKLKTEYGQSLIKKKDRAVVFCADAEQAMAFSDNYIVSKDKSSTANLKAFNQGKVNVISSCNMLNEGANLTECPMAIFLKIDASQISYTQKIGRVLRHKKPVIHLVYFKGTKEEFLINKMIQDINNN